jgi:hypothetical protein
MAGSEGGRRIKGIVVPIGADTTGIGKGLKIAANSVDKFYAKIGGAIGKSPFGVATRSVMEFGKGISALGKSVVAPLKPLIDGIASVRKQAVAGLADVAKLGAGIAAFAAAGIAAGAAFTTGGLKRIGEIGDTSLQLGIASDKLTELQFAATAAGSSAQDLDGFLATLKETVHSNIGVISPATEAFRRLGTSAEALSKLTPDRQFAELKAGFDALPDAAAKADAAVKIGGEAGIRLFKLLGMSAQQFEALKQKSKDTGFTVKPEDLAKVQAANAAFSQVGMVVDGVVNSLTVALAPAIGYVSDQFTSWFAGVSRDSKFFDVMLEGFVGGLGGLADTAVGIGLIFRDVFAGIGKAIGEAVSWIGDLLNSVAKVVPSLQGVANGVSGIGAKIKGFGDDQVESARKAREAFEKSKPSESISKAFANFKKATEESAKATAANTKATEKAATANKPLLESVGRLKTEFANAISDAGLTAEMKQIAALKRQGAEMKDIIELSREAAAVREAGKRDGLAEDLRESTKLPVEKLAEDLGRINQLLAEGKITQRQALIGAANKTKDSGIAGGQVQFAGAVQSNSNEGRSYLLSQTIGKTQDALTVARQGVAAALQGNGLLGQMLDALRKPDIMTGF